MANLGKEDQIDQLSQALLREYMHRKGYKQTLESFDQENPRNDKTIGSRNVMNGLMAMEAIQARNKGATTHKPFNTFMELLCSYRIRKRSIRTEKDAQASDSSDDDAQVEAALADKQRELDDARARLAAKEKERDDAAKALEAAKLHQKKEAKKRKKAKEAAAKKAKEEAERREASVGKLGGGSTFDPLAAAARKQSNDDDDESGAGGGGLLLGVKTQNRGNAVGSKWAPTCGMNLPTIGLGGGDKKAGGGDGGSEPEKSASAPTFLAGTGFNLSVNQLRASVDTNEAKMSPQKAHGATQDSGSDNSPPMPRAKYDPRAAAVPIVKSSLSSSHASAQAKPRGGNSSSPPGPAAAATGVSSAASSPTGTKPPKKRRVQIIADDP